MSDTTVHPNQPFDISFSSNVQKIVMKPIWEPKLHYQAIFNVQHLLLGKYITMGEPWACIADWRKWIALTPENERLCIRSTHHFEKLGMNHFAMLTDGHPVSVWQAEKVQEAHPSIHMKLSTEMEELEAWLKEAGFDLDFVTPPFEHSWLQPSDYFDKILRELGMDSTHYVSTTANKVTV